MSGREQIGSINVQVVFCMYVLQPLFMKLMPSETSKSGSALHLDLYNELNFYRRLLHSRTATHNNNKQLFINIYLVEVRIIWIHAIVKRICQGFIRTEMEKRNAENKICIFQCDGFDLRKLAVLKVNVLTARKRRYRVVWVVFPRFNKYSL